MQFKVIIILSNLWCVRLREWRMEVAVGEVLQLLERRHLYYPSSTWSSIISSGRKVCCHVVRTGFLLSGRCVQSMCFHDRFLKVCGQQFSVCNSSYQPKGWNLNILYANIDTRIWTCNYDTAYYCLILIYKIFHSFPSCERVSIELGFLILWYAKVCILWLEQ